MIEGLHNTPAPQPVATSSGKHKVLRMVKNERMGGSVPVWETVKANAVETALGNAQNAASDITAESALAYSGLPAQNISSPATSGEFGFSDLIDMVNPLQHIPVVNYVYRELSGDQIKPIAQIIGGAVFGGPMGAASGLVNVVIEQETGKDLAGNAMALAFRGETPTYRSETPQATAEPEVRLAAAQEAGAQGEIPGNLLTFVDMKHQERPQIIIERITDDNDRFAGAVSKISYPDLTQEPVHVREPITQVRLSQHRYNN